jgi:hypothetical protein
MNDFETRLFGYIGQLVNFADTEKNADGRVVRFVQRVALLVNVHETPTSRGYAKITLLRDGKVFDKDFFDGEVSLLQ